MLESLSTQFQEAWRVHNETMRLLILHLPEEALQATMSTRGGRDIARQLAHVHNVRLMQLESFLKKLPDAPEPFAKDASPDKAALLDAFEQSSAAMAQYIEACIAKDFKAANFKGGLVTLMGYFISHEAQHRGNILLTAKLKGFPLPDVLKWGIWDWNKL